MSTHDIEADELELPIKRTDGETLEDRLTANAYHNILPARYLRKDANGDLIEDPEDPEVPAGYILTERLRSQSQDPLEKMLIQTGLWSSLRLLTTGEMSTDDLDRYSEHLLAQPAAPLPVETMLSAFAAAELRSTPYAYSVDITGESTLPLIEADPMSGRSPRPVLSDADWLRLQGICGA